MFKFSIIIPAYNYAEYLPSAIESILKERYPQTEIILVNDGSTDQTQSVIDHYKSDFPHEIVGLTQPNQGVASARNKGILHATGDYVFFLDADDQLLKNTFTEVNAYFMQHPETEILFASSQTIDETGRVKSAIALTPSENKEKNFIDYLRKKITARIGSFVVKREALKQVKFSEKIKNYEDVIFATQLLALFRAGRMDAPIIQFYKHSGSLRSRLNHENHSAELLRDILFDETILPKEMFQYRAEYQSNHLLSLFRHCYLDKNLVDAKRYYKEAIKIYPKNIFRLSYLKKYVAAYF